MADAPAQPNGSDATLAGDATFDGRPPGRPVAAAETLDVPPAPPPSNSRGGDGEPARRLPRGSGDPEQIGPYRLLERVGEGGMGVVYKAEQRHPVRRLVALKVIKLGMDTREVVARFEAERQALALMSHPNVARVVDAGVTEAGRPYFAMEYVPGVPLDQYCEQAKLPTRGRLALFADVCHAVAHAHQKGIIHRDLKPSNVLVTMVDGRPVPKVIDFGIAKATGGQLTDHTLYTHTGALMGTPEYMSPEQAMTSGLDVDTRTDVYSLGVILYELLTGTLPFDAQTLRRAGVEGMARIIREQDPPRPSTRLTMLAEPDPIAPAVDSATAGLADPPSPARRTGTPRGDAKALRREVRGDLDWITLKAMEKDRTRRYDSPAALAADLRRYLDDEPVAARPPTATYRIGKFVRKHRIAVAAAGAVAAALVLGLGAATYGLVRARQDRDVAVAARADADRQRLAADAARTTADAARAAAERATAEVEAANLFLRDLFMAFGNVPGARDRLAASVRRLDGGWLRDQPKTHAACRIAVGYFFIAQNVPREAERQFLAALETSRGPGGSGPAPHAAAPVYAAVGSLRERSNDPAGAERYYRLAVAAFGEIPDGQNGVGTTLESLARVLDRRGDLAGARSMRLDALAARVADRTAKIAAAPADAQAYADRAGFRVRLGQFEDALADLRRATDLDPANAAAWYVRAPLHLYVGDEPGYRDAAATMLRRFAAAEQPDVAERAAKVCLLDPRPVGDVADLVRLADRAESSTAASATLLPWFHLCRGMAELRAGRPDVALDKLARARALDSIPAQATIDFYAALAHHAAGRPDQARTWLDEGVRRMDKQIPRPGTDDLASPENYLVCAIARREAERTIGAGGGPRRARRRPPPARRGTETVSR